MTRGCFLCASAAGLPWKAKNLATAGEGKALRPGLRRPRWGRRMSWRDARRPCRPCGVTLPFVPSDLQARPTLSNHLVGQVGHHICTIHMAYRSVVVRAYGSQILVRVIEHPAKTYETLHLQAITWAAATLAARTHICKKTRRCSFPEK